MHVWELSISRILVPNTLSDLVRSHSCGIFLLVTIFGAKRNQIRHYCALPTAVLLQIVILLFWQELLSLLNVTGS